MLRRQRIMVEYQKALKDGLAIGIEIATTFAGKSHESIDFS